MTIHRFRLEPLVPIREALLASVEQARADDIIDLGAIIASAGQVIATAGCDLMSDMDADEPHLIAVALTKARRIIAACDEYAATNVTHGA